MNTAVHNVLVSLCAGVALAAGAVDLAAAKPFVKEVLAKPILHADAAMTSYTTVFNQIEAADAAADNAWLKLRTRAEYDAYRKDMHAKMVAAIGGIPARSPLNAKVVATIPRDGYRIEKILFESYPGVYVTALGYIPDDVRFKAPYPAFIITCGHSANGKGSSDYQRGCVQGAQQGFAAFIYDPINQGERTQVPNSTNCNGHNRQGVLATLLGRSMAQFRIFDGMRMIDYVASRPDVKPSKIGYMGNSGGGTMTSLMMAIDPRIAAAAPACYLSSIREVYDHCGPQDAEQNIFGQLAFGLNHASFVLLQDMPVRLHCCHNDFFTFMGSRQTIRTVQETAANVGLAADRYGMTDVPGPHGWKESTRTSSVQWMRRWLMDDEKALPIDVFACRRLDLGFNVKEVDHGLDDPDYNVTPNGKVADLPGFRSVYDYLRDDLQAALAKRVPGGAAAAAQRRAGIAAHPVHFDKALATTERDGLVVRRDAFQFADGLVVPAITIAAKDASKGTLLVVSDGKRVDALDVVLEKVAAGWSVTVADVMGTGEIGKMKHTFYGAKDTPEEELAVSLYTLGKSLVGVRAEEIIVLAEALKQRTGRAVQVRAVGRLAIPAAHAKAVRPELFAGVETVKAPLSWREAVETAAIYRFTNAVQGGLLDYDWTDLLK